MKTKEEIKKALLESIDHWDRISKGLEATHGGRDCALCQLFGADCSQCPVCEITGAAACRSVGFFEFVRHVQREHLYPLRLSTNLYEGHYRIYCPECVNLATNVRKNLRVVYGKWTVMLRAKKYSPDGCDKSTRELRASDLEIVEDHAFISLKFKDSVTTVAPRILTFDSAAKSFYKNLGVSKEACELFGIQQDSDGRVQIID